MFVDFSWQTLENQEINTESTRILRIDESGDSQIIKITARNQTNVYLRTIITAPPTINQSPCTVSVVLTKGYPVHGVFERLARFKLRRSQSSDLEGLTGLRIAPGTGRPFSNPEAAEAGDLHLAPIS